MCRGRTDYASSGTRHDHLNALGFTEFGAHHAAVRLGDLRDRWHAFIGECFLQRTEIVRDARLNVSMDQRGDRALILAHDRPNFARAIDVHLRILCADDIARGSFVSTIAIGVEQRDHDRFGAALARVFGGCEYTCLIERRVD